MSPSHAPLSITCYHMRIKWETIMLKPSLLVCCVTPSLLCAGLLVSSPLLWQAPNLIQRHCLPGWPATHYGLHLTLGK